MLMNFFKSEDKFVVYRIKLLNQTIAAFIIASSVNLIFTINTAIQTNWQTYAVSQTLAVSLFIIMWLTRNNLSYNTKIFGLISCAYTIVFGTIINIGATANSKAGVIVILLMASIFLDQPYILLVFIAVFLGLIIISYLAVNHLITFSSLAYELQAHSLATWANMNIVVLAGGSVAAWVARSMINELIISSKAAEMASQAKTQFLANVSHELRTPLSNIIGFTNILLEQREQLTTKQYEQLKIIANSGNSLLHLINDILDLVRAETGRLKLQMQAVSLSLLFTEIIHTVQPYSDSKGLVLRFEIEKNLPSQLLLDGERLRQIVFNLLNNAIKFTDHGEISLVVNGNHLDQSHFELIISIADSGEGISSFDQERIFIPFEQVDRDVNKNLHGLGLGLSVSRQLAQLMGGELTLTSVLNVGSTFILKLPVTIDNVNLSTNFNYHVPSVAPIIIQSIATKLNVNDLPLDTDLNVLRELAKFGMVSEIQDWLNANADSYPQFTQRLNELVWNCDLQMVIKFLDEYYKKI